MFTKKSTPSLRRRRGTGSSSANTPLRRLLIVLIAIAVLICLGLVVLLFTLQQPAALLDSDTSTAAKRPPGVPNFFRGRAFPKVEPKAAVLPTTPGTDLNAANTVGQPPSPKEVDMGMYDQPPTVLYPYPLLLVSLNETSLGENFVVRGGKRYTEYTTGGTPYVVTDDIQQASDTVARSRRHHVKKAMQHAWGGYTTYAFGGDEVLPQSKRAANPWGGQGVTLVDSLDTLWLMDMKDEFWKARDWVRDNLSHGHVGQVSTFETTIRDLGGLLSAYDWSGDETFLTHALDLGNRLLHAFDSGGGIFPTGRVNLQGGGGGGGQFCLAEIASLQIENRYLSKVSGEPQFAQKTEHVFEVLNEMAPGNGLYPYFLRLKGETPEFKNGHLTFGAMADSAYEYMLKMWLQGGQTETMYRDMYDKAMDGMHDELKRISTPSGLTFIGDKDNGRPNDKMDHLACFMGGLLALGAYTDPQGLESARAQRDLRTAKALTYTCYQMYARMNTGISAEYIQFREGGDFDIGRGAPHYLLRPETVESFFILNQLTGDPIYREWGWEVFQAIEKYCKTDIAYGELSNVADTNGKPRDKMESFFLAETIKYLYLLFDPDTEVDVLHKHVFNTEAHPTRIFPLVDLEKKAQS
jgi:hypothetical protein